MFRKMMLLALMFVAAACVHSAVAQEPDPVFYAFLPSVAVSQEYDAYGPVAAGYVPLSSSGVIYWPYVTDKGTVRVPSGDVLVRTKPDEQEYEVVITVSESYGEKIQVDLLDCWGNYVRGSNSTSTTTTMRWTSRGVAYFLHADLASLPYDETPIAIRYQLDVRQGWSPTPVPEPTPCCPH